MSRRTPFVALGLALAAVVGALPTTAAAAEETAAWSVTPSDAAGVHDGRTRFELEVDPGQAVEQHVLITNSSTVDREFAVYGADAMNTPSGGYDLQPAAVPAVDVGAWIAVSQPTVTIAALSTAVVPFTVTVPAGATPGDHPGGIVVSPVRAQVTQDGVLVDTRLAVRLSVRVAGEVTPALEVRSLSGSFDSSLVPFAAGATTLTYDVVNTGNVKVIGLPRVRLTGPLGIELADIPGEGIREVLPGESFAVSVVLDDVLPLGYATAVVDVEMAAAPGPQTEIPLVSSTARATVVLMSWTGLLVVVLVVAGVVALIRYLRTRRREHRAFWAELERERREGDERDRQDVVVQGAASAAGTTVAVLLGLVLAVGAALGTAPPAHAGDAQTSAVQSGDDPDGSVTLTVPKAASTVPGTSVPSSSVPRRSPGGGVALPAEQVAEDAAVVDDVTPDAAPATRPAPDLVWADLAGRLTPGQFGLVGLGGAAGLGALALALRVLLAGRRNGAVS